MIGRRLHKTQRWLLLTCPAPVSSKCRFDPQETRQVFNIPIRASHVQMNTVFQRRYFGEQRTGSNTAVTNKNVCGPLLELPFVSIMRRTRQIHPLGHMFAYDQKWSYPAYPAKWPNVFSLLDLGITLGFFVQTQTYCQKTKIC